MNSTPQFYSRASARWGLLVLVCAAMFPVVMILAAIAVPNYLEARNRSFNGRESYVQHNGQWVNESVNTYPQRPSQDDNHVFDRTPNVEHRAVPVHKIAILPFFFLLLLLALLLIRSKRRIRRRGGWRRRWRRGLDRGVAVAAGPVNGCRPEAATPDADLLLMQLDAQLTRMENKVTGLETILMQRAAPEDWHY